MASDQNEKWNQHELESAWSKTISMEIIVSNSNEMENALFAIIAIMCLFLFARASGLSHEYERGLMKHFEVDCYN